MYPPPPQQPDPPDSAVPYPQTAPHPQPHPAKNSVHLATIVTVVAGVLAIPLGLSLIGETRAYPGGFGAGVLVGVGFAIGLLVLVIRAVARAGERPRAQPRPVTPVHPTAAPPPGWYQNPHGMGRRWWDGQRWTEHLQQPH